MTKTVAQIAAIISKGRRDMHTCMVGDFTQVDSHIILRVNIGAYQFGENGPVYGREGILDIIKAELSR